MRNIFISPLQHHCKIQKVYHHHLTVKVANNYALQIVRKKERKNFSEMNRIWQML